MKGEYRRQGVKNALSSFDPMTILDLDIPFDETYTEKIKEISPYLNIKTWSTRTFFGVTPEFLDLCDEKEKELISDGMTNMHMFADLLMNLKYTKTKDDSPIGIFVDSMYKLKRYI